MNSIAMLSKKNLKSNKMRNSLIIITIVLTTALVTTIGITTISISKMLQQQLIMKSGMSHGSFGDVNYKQLQLLKNNKSVYSMGEQKWIGYIANESISAPMLILTYENENMLNSYNGALEAGNMPTKSNEIAVERWVLKKLNIKATIGTSIPLRYTKITDSQDDQSSSNIIEDTFILSGILNDNKNNQDIYVSQILTSKEFINNNYELGQCKFSVEITLKKTGNIEQSLYDISKDVGIQYKDVYVNNDYIKTHSIDWQVIIPCIVIILVVIFTAFIVIYNIFHVSIVSKVQQFGLLSALGATPNQIKKIVLREGLFLALIGIPFGVMVGSILSLTISSKFNFADEKLQIYINPLIVIISVLVSLVTVVISIRKPAKIASQISPIEAVRYCGAVEYKNNGTRKVCRQVNLKKLAYINLWRNRKKIIITILSLSMSGIIFIIFSTILSSMNVDKLVETFIRSDFQLNINQQAMFSKENILDEALTKELQSIAGVKSVNSVYYAPVTLQNQKTDSNESVEVSSECYGYDDNLINELKSYLVKGNISMAQMRANNEVLLVEDPKWSSSYKIGDKVSLRSLVDGKDIKKEFTISGIVSKNIEWLGSSGEGPAFITSSDVFINKFNNKKVMRLSINANSNYEEIRNSLKVVQSRGNITFVDKQQLREKYEKDLSTIKTAVMILVVIIGLIAIINQINTMITSIFSRRKEIGVLQAIAVSDKQLVRMLQLEGFYLSIISIGISVPIGSVLGYFFYTVFNRVAAYSIYKYPFLNVLLLIVAFIVIQILITHLVTNNLRKDSIVQKIQYSE